MIFILSLSCLPLTAQTAPATQSVSDLIPLVAKLDDSDAEVRDAASEQLMGLHSNDLQSLRTATANSQPISANQAAQLHHVVEHVYLSDLTYPTDPEQSPFLGLYWPQGDGNIVLAGGPIRVVCRLPGFDSHRVLRDGDTIISVGDNVVSSSTHNQFIELIHGYKPGQTVRLTIERHGKIEEIHCRLSTRPAYFNNHDSETVTEWIDQRVKQAGQYWQTNFAPLVGSSPAL